MPDRAQLPIASTLRRALSEVVRARDPLTRALLAPATFVALTAVVYRFTVLSDRTSLAAWTLRLMIAALLAGAVSGVAAVLIAVSAHRLVLLGEGALPAKWGVYWSGRELGFLGRAIALGLLVTIPIIIASAAVAYWARGVPWNHEIKWAMTVLFAYPTARLSLVLPAQATDEPLTFAESWRASSGNGWRLAVVLLTVPLSLEALRFGLSFLPMPEHVAFAGARSFSFCALGVFEIASLSVSYRWLRAHPPNGR